MQQELHSVGIDVAKQVFHRVGADTTGKMLWRKRLSRHALMPFIAPLPSVCIGIEAGGGAHDWARRFREPGHEVKLMAPQFVKSNQNERRDAEAIAEALPRPTLRFVPLQAIEPQDIQSLPRVRERLIGERTAWINDVPGLMHASGIVRPKGESRFRPVGVEKLASAKDKLTALSQAMLGPRIEEVVDLEQRIAFDQEKLDGLAQTPPEGQRLMTIPGRGPLPVTALIAAVGEVGVFKNGCQFAAWLGWVPKPHSTGGQTR
jgi:transposase